MQRPLFRTRETGKALLITRVFSNLTFNFKLTQCYKGVNITRLLSLIIRSHFISIWANWAVAIRVTDIHFVEKDHSLLLQWIWSCLPLRMGNTTPKARLPSTVS